MNRIGLHLLAPCVLVTVSSVAIGCGGSGGEGDVGSTSSAITNASEKTAFDFFVQKGLSKDQAAGIVGNLQQESSMDPSVSQYGGGPGRGIAQWSAGGRWDHDSKDNVVWYASTKGQSPYSLELQLDFIWYELTTFSSYGLGQLRGSTNVTGATLAFQTDFEGCGECDQTMRIEYAIAAYDAFAKGDVPASSPTVNTGNIATIARANVGKGACSANSKGGHDFDSSCTGNGGYPEYWCADFARWVWSEAGINTAGLTAAAGSFYTYGVDHGTLHSTPSVGDAVVFDYQGGGVAEHVAIVVLVNSDGTIETVSGDWGGDSGSEAEFASTSHAVLNTPAYPSAKGTAPKIMGMTISAYVAPAGTSGGSSGNGGSASSGGSGGGGCYSHTLGREMPQNACVQSDTNHDWFECDDGNWADRATDPAACSSIHPLESAGSEGCYSDTLGKEMPDNACVQSKYDGDWYQCSNGSWDDRWTDPATCDGTYAL